MLAQRAALLQKKVKVEAQVERRPIRLGVFPTPQPEPWPSDETRAVEDYWMPSLRGQNNKQALREHYSEEVVRGAQFRTNPGRYP